MLEPMNEADTKQLITAMQEVFPTAEMVQRGFDHVDMRFNDVDKRFNTVEERLGRIENFLLADHKKRIENLEQEVKSFKNALAM